MAEPIQMPMNDATALRLLRDIASDSANVIFTDHAKKRMRERNVTSAQVMVCLARGAVYEPVALDIYGNWKLTVSHRVSGAAVNVAVAIDVPSRAIIVTVF